MSSWPRLRARLWTAILRGTQEAHDEVGRDPSEETVAMASSVLAHIDDVLVGAAAAQPPAPRPWLGPSRSGIAGATDRPASIRDPLTAAQVAALTVASSTGGEFPLAVDPVTIDQLRQVGLADVHGDFPHIRYLLSARGRAAAARVAWWAPPDAWARVQADDELDELRAHRGVDAQSNGWLCGVCDAVLTPNGVRGTSCSFCGRRYNDRGAALCEVDGRCVEPLDAGSAVPGACLAHSHPAWQLGWGDDQDQS